MNRKIIKVYLKSLNIQTIRKLQARSIYNFKITEFVEDFVILKSSPNS